MIQRIKRRVRVVAFSVAGVVLAAASVQAQAGRPATATLIAQLSSPAPATRSTAADQLLASTTLMKDPAVLSALVRLLDRENGEIARSYRQGVGVSREFGEGYSEYYSRLLSALAQPELLRDDRTLRIVAEGSYNPDSKLVQTIADVGGARIVPTALALTTSDVLGSRWSGLAVLARVYERRNAHGIAPETARQIKDRIVAGTRDRSTRRVSIDLLGVIGEADDLPLLNTIATTDPDSRPHDRTGRIFPMREAARAAVQLIEQRELARTDGSRGDTPVTPGGSPAHEVSPPALNVPIAGAEVRAVADPNGLQLNQSVLSREILGGNTTDRARAIDAARGLGPSADVELRQAVMTALAQAVDSEQRRYEADRRGERLPPLEDAQLLTKLVRVVATWRDPQAIPVLASALGSSSITMDALADFGELAVPALLDVVGSPTVRPDAVNHGLIVLRFIIEDQSHPVSADALTLIGRAARQRMQNGGGSLIVTLWYAIDLAAVLEEAEARRTLEAIASDRDEVIRRGVTDAQLIAATQKRAADGLAGVPPKPRRAR